MKKLNFPHKKILVYKKLSSQNKKNYIPSKFSNFKFLFFINFFLFINLKKKFISEFF